MSDDTCVDKESESKTDPRHKVDEMVQHNDAALPALGSGSYHHVATVMQCIRHGESIKTTGNKFADLPSHNKVPGWPVDNPAGHMEATGTTPSLAAARAGDGLVRGKLPGKVSDWVGVSD